MKFPIGEAKTRITELVSRYRMSYDARARAQLVEALPPLLEPLLESGAAVSDE
ncbi:MAG: hypothetical protein JSW71_08645 [Gemmatimonadota bacterium]|nr:MAG: hypothetical protein JSW71_08645 [Gemmatimonadota bacterium]